MLQNLALASRDSMGGYLTLYLALTCISYVGGLLALKFGQSHVKPSVDR